MDAFAFGDGRAGAVKIDDGAMRARTPVTVALLRALGVHDGADKAALDELAVVEVRGGDGVVGAIRPSPGAFDPAPGAFDQPS